jgi:dihydroxyacetone kinase-like protein
VGEQRPVIALEVPVDGIDVAALSLARPAGECGTGATVFVEKIAGALAEQKRELKAVADVAREVNDRSRSFGVALTACTVPTAGQPGFDLPEDEIELGVGIHGEPGRERGKLRSAKEIVDFSLSAIDDDMPLEGELLVMVNGMGGTPLVELYVVYNEVAKFLAAKGATVSRSLVGNYITSLDMAGASITVLRLTPDLARLWDAPVETPALRWGR